MSASDLKRMKELEASFLNAIDEHHKIISTICFTWCRQRADQEDLYQEIVVQLWKAFPSFKGNSKLSTWIYGVAIRSAMLPYRTSQVKIELRDELPDRPSEERPEEGLDDRLLGIFQGLPIIDRAILLMTMEDFDRKEIAAALSLTEYAVSSRLKRIRDVAWWVK